MRRAVYRNRHGTLLDFRMVYFWDGNGTVFFEPDNNWYVWTER